MIYRTFVVGNCPVEPLVADLLLGRPPRTYSRPYCLNARHFIYCSLNEENDTTQDVVL